MDPKERAPAPLAFAVPDLDGPPTGGTRYNRRLIDALVALGQAPRVCSLDDAAHRVTQPGPQTLWVDSLWLGAIPRLVQRASAGCRVGLLAHWLPTLVSYGERPPLDALSDEERGALAHAEGALAPSEFLASELAALGFDPARVQVLEPGSELPVTPYPAEHSPRAPVRAVMIANLLPGKGVLPLLEGLAARLRPDDALELSVIGHRAMDADYAARCDALASGHPMLRARVTVVGSRPHPACIDTLLASDLLVSASRMESYGMALADARAAGRPILARRGGHVAAHVDADGGGRLVDDETELADALLALVRDRAALAERQRRAWARRTQRAWSSVASRLLEVSERWPPPRPR